MVGGFSGFSLDYGTSHYAVVSKTLQSMNTDLYSRLPMSQIYRLPEQIALTIIQAQWLSCGSIRASAAVWSLPFSKENRRD